MKRLKSLSIPRIALMSAVMLGALGASLAANAFNPQYVWVTLYYDANGNVVGGRSWGDCPIGNFGPSTAWGVTQVYECNDPLPY